MILITDNGDRTSLCHYKQPESCVPRKLRSTVCERPLYLVAPGTHDKISNSTMDMSSSMGTSRRDDFCEYMLLSIGELTRESFTPL